MALSRAAAIFVDGTERQSGDGRREFTLRLADQAALDRILAKDTYSAAMAYVRGEFEVDGDLCAAIRWKGWRPESRLRARLLTVIAQCATVLESVYQSKAQTAQHIRFHNDRSNEFYRLSSTRAWCIRALISALHNWTWRRRRSPNSTRSAGS